MRKLHNIFWLPGDHSLVPEGSIIAIPHDPGHNDSLSGIDQAYLTDRGLRVLVLLPYSSDELSNPASYVTRLNAFKAVLQARGITPWAISLGDEAFDVCNSPSMLAWPCFAGMTRPIEDMTARKQWLQPRLTQLFALTKQVFPSIPTMQVETMYSEDTTNIGLWHPDCGADIRGIDPYLWTDGCGWLGTAPLTPTTPASPKFGMEVGWLCTGTPAGFLHTVTGAFAGNKPVVLIAQAFHDLAGQWRQLPTVAQMRWYHEWGNGQAPIIGMGWYGIKTIPGLSVGLDSLPEHYAAVLGMIAEMATGTPVPDPVAAGAPPPVVVPPSPPVVPPTGASVLTSTDGRFRLVMQPDGNVVAYGPDGTAKGITGVWPW